MRTVGSYWPYATTVFDYVRRAMPFAETKSLTSDELYAVTAYVLHLNGIVGDTDAMSAETLPKVTDAEPRRLRDVQKGGLAGRLEGETQMRGAR